jgi:hypothetical protein
VSNKDLQSGDGVPSKSTLTLPVGVLKAVLPLDNGPEDGESAAVLVSEPEPEPCLPFLSSFFPAVGERNSLPVPRVLLTFFLDWESCSKGDGVLAGLFGISKSVQEITEFTKISVRLSFIVQTFGSDSL